jgi:hypothetical protein
MISFEIKRQFLQENQPLGNLELLAAPNLAETSVTTETAYRKLPKWNLSSSDRREITLLNTAITAMAGLASLFHSLGILAEEEFKKNPSNPLDVFDVAHNTLSCVYRISAFTLAAAGVFAATRYFLNDKTQGERFELIHQEYAKAALFLEQRRGTGKPVVEIARTLSRNLPQINASLRHFVRLTPSQADFLTAKLSHAAKGVLKETNR